MTQTIDRMVAEPDALVASGLGPNVAIHGFDTPLFPLQATPPKVSLLTSAFDITSELQDEQYGDHWINGIAFEPEAGALNLSTNFPYWWHCAPSVGANPSRAATANSPSGVKQIPTKPTNVTYTPYIAHTADPCISTFGMFGRDGHGRARRLLAANLSRIMENELWTGARATMAGFPNDFFTNAPTALNGGAATGFVSAFVELEQGIFDLDNGPGMIHAQPRLVQHWLRNSLVTPSPSGRQIVSALGTVVVPGTGYPGTGTGLAVATHSRTWAYGTGPVVYARTPIEDQSLDEHELVATLTNVRNVRAESYVAATWSSVVKVGILVDLLNELS